MALEGPKSPHTAGLDNLDRGEGSRTETGGSTGKKLVPKRLAAYSPGDSYRSTATHAYNLLRVDYVSRPRLRTAQQYRRGEEITIAVNGMAAAKLVGVPNGKRDFLTTANLMAMRPTRGAPDPKSWDYELDGDTTNDFGPTE